MKGMKCNRRAHGEKKDADLECAERLETILSVIINLEVFKTVVKQAFVMEPYLIESRRQDLKLLGREEEEKAKTE